MSSRAPYDLVSDIEIENGLRCQHQPDEPSATSTLTLLTQGSSNRLDSSDVSSTRNSSDRPRSPEPHPKVKATTRIANTAAHIPTWLQHQYVLQLWWLEIICCILAVGAIIATIITLRMHEDEPLPGWPYGQSINAIVAVYTLNIKASAGLVLAKGISHLKWTALSRPRPQPLHTFVVHDNASRAPWGATRLLWRNKRAAYQLDWLNKPAIGTVSYNTTCVRIRWAWISYSASLAGMLLLFLVCTVIQSKRRQAESPSNHDFKSNILTLLFHGLEHESQQQLEHVGHGHRTKELEINTRDVGVRLRRTGQGWRLTSSILGKK